MSPLCLPLGTAAAKIKVPSAENPELSNVFFKAWSRLQYSLACYACRKKYERTNFYFVSSSHFILSKSSLHFLRVPAAAVSHIDLRNIPGHPARRQKRLMPFLLLRASEIQTDFKSYPFCVYLKVKLTLPVIWSTFFLLPCTFWAHILLNTLRRTCLDIFFVSCKQLK